VGLIVNCLYYTLKRTVSIYWLVADSTLLQCINVTNPSRYLSERVSLVKPSPLRFRALQFMFTGLVIWLLVWLNGYWFGYMVAG